jgi:serine/threonine protein kinase
VPPHEQELPRTIGKYEIVRRLAYGGMAEVLLGRISGADGFVRHVVVKRVLPQHSENSSFIAMFRDEARITAQLFHGNIGQVIEFGEQDGQHYLVLEYVHGPSLSTVLSALKKAGRRLSFAEAAYITVETARALDYAHRKRGKDGAPLMVVHRDVSPSNILLSLEGEVKLVDFGIARARARITPTAHGAGVVKGKLSYLSPEALDGRAGARADLFALGVVAHEMLTGSQLFFGSSEAEVIYKVMAGDIPRPSTIVDDVPPAFDNIVMRLLERDPEKRPLRGLEVAEALGPIATSATTPAMESLAATLVSLDLAAPEPGATRAASTGSKLRRVLVVDQSRTVRALVRNMLREDFHVVDASTAEEALALVNDTTPAAVVCQAVLPGRSGANLCQEMRRNPALGSTPFVLLASDPSEELAAEAERSGVTRVLPKRLDGTTLRDTLRELLG